jgi:hypothetical protein
MARILSQTSVFDYSEIEELGDLERLQLAFEGIDDEALMLRLEARRGRGRNEYPIRVMFNFIVAMKVFGHRTVESFRRELKRNCQLRKICGQNDFLRRGQLVPPSRVFTFFLRLLQSEQAEVDRIFSTIVAKLYELLPNFGVNLAGDGKYIDSYAKGKCKRSNLKAGARAEHDAAYSRKEYYFTDKNGNKRTESEYHYGFKQHTICDVNTELPVSYTVTKANRDERGVMKELLSGLTSEQQTVAKTLALDKGYDGKELIRQIKSMAILPVVDIRNCWKDGEATKQYKDTDIVYNYKGEVFYVDNQGKLHKMRYKGYDGGKKCLRYEYGGKIYKIYISYDERIFLPIARDSMKFKRLYKGRTAVERFNGRLDRDYCFEDHCLRGLGKTKLMVSLSLIIMNGMALGKIKRGCTEGLAAYTKCPAA